MYVENKALVEGLTVTLLVTTLTAHILLVLKNSITDCVIGEVERLSGDNRQDTNGAVISEFYTSGKELYDNEGVVFAKSEDSGLVDALGAGVYAGKVKAPIVLASKGLTYEQEDALKDIKVKDKLYQVGYGVDSSVIEFLR